MKKVPLILLIFMTTILMAACGGAPDSGIVPAADRPTFIFFFTEG